MNDGIAALGFVSLLAVGAFAVRYHMVLQPNRGAAVAYMSGLVAWGVALYALWLVWSASGGCRDEACQPAVEAVEETLAELPSEF